MSDAEDAYKEAERLIEKSREEGHGILQIESENTIALSTLPPQIADEPGFVNILLNNTQIEDISILPMKWVNLLELSNTQITDSSLLGTILSGKESLSSLDISNTLITENSLLEIAGLDHLDILEISNTMIADLRPIRNMTSLLRNDYKPFRGLFFRNIPALNLDDKLKELSEIDDNYERTTKTLAYLREVGDNWPPIPTTSPDQDTILTVSQTDEGRLDISPATPAADELTDTVKRKAHQLLQQATKSLEQIAGNMHPRLAATARTLSLHIDCPLQEVDMLDVHFELEALRGTYERRGERKGEDIFGDDVIDALDKVLMIGPGLVLDNEQVERLEARRDRYRGAPPTPDVQAAQDQFSDGIALDPTLFGDTIRNYSVTFKEGHAEGSERLQAGQGILNKNTLIYVGSVIVSGMAGGPLSALGNDLLAWLVAQSETISVLAPTWGTAFEAWITPVMMRAREANVAARALLKRPD